MHHRKLHGGRPLARFGTLFREISSTSMLAQVVLAYYKCCMEEMKQTISVLIERVEDWWVAQCIEHDLATQARSLDELHHEVESMLVAHIRSCEELGIEPFKRLPPAPPEVREKFERAKFAVTIRGMHPVHGTQLQHRIPTPDSRIAA